MSAAFIATVAAYLSHKNHHKNQKDKSISTDEDKLVPPTIACSPRLKISAVDPAKLIYVDFGVICSLIIVAVVIIFKSYLLLKNYFY